MALPMQMPPSFKAFTSDRPGNPLMDRVIPNNNNNNNNNNNTSRFMDDSHASINASFFGPGRASPNTTSSMNLTPPSPSPYLSGNMSSSYRKAMALLGTLSRSFGLSNGALSSSVAMSLSKSIGRSWTRENFLDVAHQLAQRSPMLVPSPSRDLAQFAVLEDQFCKDFKCCGISLENLHDLLHHFEECHVRVDSEYGDDDDLPFDFMDEDMDYSDDNQNFSSSLSADDQSDRAAAVNLSFADLAFLRAHVASLDRKDSSQISIPPVHLPATAVTTPLPQLSLRGSISQESSSTTKPLPASSSTMITTTATPSTLLTSFRQPTVPPTSTSNIAMSDIYGTRKPTQPEHNDMEVDGGDADEDDFADDEMFSRQHRRPTVPHAWASTAAPPTRSQRPHSSTGKPPSSALAAREFIAVGGGPPPGLIVSDHPTPMDAFLRNKPRKPISTLTAFAIPKESREETLRRQSSLCVSSLHPVHAVPLPSTSPDSEKRGNGNESDEANGGGGKEDRPYRCRVDGCVKAYKNPGGLKYHMVHGHAEDTGDPEMNHIIQKPYLCPVAACEKRYKNLNGLKYHIEHAHSALVENP